MTLTPVNSGWLEVICGNMFSGKTEELIRRLRRAQIAKVSTVIFKPEIDSRFSNEYIVSHNMNRLKSIIIARTSEIIEISEDYGFRDFISILFNLQTKSGDGGIRDTIYYFYLISCIIITIALIFYKKNINIFSFLNKS